MSSQKSSGLTKDPEAVLPKRARGRLRVAAILDAAAAVIAERGYQVATMSEIAARSSTAIGSLYRFFPTKDVLADALLDRYVDEIRTTLTTIRDRAAALGAAGIADALVDLILDLRADRGAAIVLVDARADGPARRKSLRRAMRLGLASILQAAAPTLSAHRAAVAAPVVLHVMKTAPALLEARSETTGLDPDSESHERLEELRNVLRLYIAHLVAAAEPPTGAAYSTSSSGPRAKSGTRTE